MAPPAPDENDRRARAHFERLRLENRRDLADLYEMHRQFHLHDG